jgi:deazaflavin-dependent oxidoreductase (nitroreductase family)
MRKALAVGLAVGAASAAYLAWRSRIPTAQRDRWARRLMNERIAPALMGLGLARGGHARTGIVEHVGRSSGAVRRTLIYPVPLGDRFAVPLPYGPEAHWPKNVLTAGRARLEYRGQVYELVDPRPVGWAEIEDMPRSDALIGRLIGGRFLVADVASVAEGGFEPAPA